MLNLGEVLLATRGELRGAWRQTAFSRLVIDSRAVTPGCLFVAIKGQHHDGHAYVAETLASGAAGAIVEHAADAESDTEGPPLIVVPSTVEALGQMVRYALDRQPHLEVVGITGSLGKTTTKEVVASVLGTRYQVLKTEGNLNSEIGLPLTVLNGLAAEHEIAVLEMAMYQLGDIRHLARLARPRVGVVTAVLPVHLQRLGTIERIQQAKQELVEELPSTGVAVLNGDDPRVASMATATPARVVRYGVGDEADVRAEQIESHGLRGVEFDLLHDGQRRHVHLPLLGAHSVHAALAAAAVASEEGLTLTDTAEALQLLSPALRLLVVEGVNGSRIVDDSYNASPESVLAALNLLRELPGQRKIAVLGDMLELGSEEEPGHRRVGNRAAAVVDLLVVYGPRSHATAQEALEAGLRADQVFEAESHAAIVDLLRGQLQPGDDVLVKGSLAMGMAEVVRGIRAEGTA
ncbi:MAG: UDP-N-acetylmuramoyl-tripeptide--D-alanyl-D-alanine ligase [Chloroflexi bacterium]|nr:UDP-N-acetylmuramoyl-tripeptide--D-alanyl-D-alanine ligase [Chloroflexota bacterium]MBV9597695.1 UDP-N-acetylmuramoyl-tripeptide--D-alanyl-D-alanine ligase [Chloroflexota bacterium]